MTYVCRKYALLCGCKESKTMLEKIFNLLFTKKSISKITTISKENRIIKETVIKEKPQINCGIYSSMEDREKFYQKLFSACNQL